MTWTFTQVRPHVALRGRFRAVWAISARGVPAPVSNQLFYPISRWRLALGRVGPSISSQNNLPHQPVHEAQPRAFFGSLIAQNIRMCL
jgi:hypothetical protein